MGGQVGTQFDVSITGQNLDGSEKLIFSHNKIKAWPKLNEQGQPVPNQYVVKISDDCPVGIHEACVMTRLGISSSRVFNVDRLPEVTQTKPNTTLGTALALEVNSICNSVMTNLQVDYYSFKAKKGQRIVVDCAAKGIDSKLNPVLIIADAQGMDLQVDRRGGVIDFQVPATGQYVIKVHGLTYKGGPYYFYRLALREAKQGEVISRMPSVRNVNAFSWPPEQLNENNVITEVDSSSGQENIQRIKLPCDIKGSFYPAADVDTFEFNANKGEVWWVEVASERLGRPTDPAIVVQHVLEQGKTIKVTDLVELTDIPSPVKVSSNGYSYDGPPYNAGSSDIIGKIEIKQDGIHRLQLRDLFGGTRNDPRNFYRMIIRKEAPDFALVGWALHMNLRNGDRNALSKPIALRAGTTMPIEVVVIRRDGFNGPIDLYMENLPEGVQAVGLKIPKGKSRGIMLITAAENAPRGLSTAKMFGTANINGKLISRKCHLASMQWPIKDASSEVPSPRLLSNIFVSVGGEEMSPITIAPLEKRIWEVNVGDKLTIPLEHICRSDFSGANITLKAYGVGFEKFSALEVPLKTGNTHAVFDFAKMKTPPGEYSMALYGYAVAKYRDNLASVEIATSELKQARINADKLAADEKKLSQNVLSAAVTERGQLQKAAKLAAEKSKSAQQAVKLAEKKLKFVTNRAKPKDIVDIIVSTPIKIRVNSVKKAK